MHILTTTWRNSREKGEEFNMVSEENELKKGLGPLSQPHVREWTMLPHGTEKNHLLSEKASRRAER